MVRLVLLLNSFLVISLMWSGCRSHESAVVVDALDVGLKSQNDVLYKNSEPFTGEVFSLYLESGDTAEIRTYRLGKEHGVWQKFYAGGSFQEVRKFDNGRKTGNYEAWWENGKRKLQYHFNNDDYQGICREWNASGMLIKEMHYTDGHEQGAQKMFYDNGKVRANYVILNGRRFGLLGTKNCVNASDSVFKN